MKRREELLNNNNSTFNFGNFKSLGLKHNGIFDTINRDIELVVELLNTGLDIKYLRKPNIIVILIIKTNIKKHLFI